MLSGGNVTVIAFKSNPETGGTNKNLVPLLCSNWWSADYKKEGFLAKHLNLRKGYLDVCVLW